MTDIVNRLKRFMLDQNINSALLADSLSISRSRISHLLTGRNNPSLEIVTSILSYYKDMNPDWLIFGEEPMYRPGSENNTQKTGLSESHENQKFDPSSKEEPNLFNYDGFNQEHVKAESSDKPVYQKRKERNSEQVSQQSNDIASGEDIRKEPEKILLLFTDGSFKQYVPAR